MSADGNWNIVVSTPMGDRPATLSVKTDGNALTGSQGTERKFGGHFRRYGQWQRSVLWKVSITDPMPMTLEFTGTINGDAIGGSVKLGAFGTSSFSGTRG